MAATLRQAIGCTPAALAEPISRALERWRQIVSAEAAYVSNGPHGCVGDMRLSRQGSGGDANKLRAAASGRRVDVMQWATALSRALLRALGPSTERGVLLSRALGQWQVAIVTVGARELKKGLGAANERARNLKQGWHQEREERRRVSEALSHAEAAVSKQAGEVAAVQSERERWSHLAAQSAPTTARVRSLEAQVTLGSRCAQWMMLSERGAGCCSCLLQLSAAVVCCSCMCIASEYGAAASHSLHSCVHSSLPHKRAPHVLSSPQKLIGRRWLP